MKKRLGALVVVALLAVSAAPILAASDATVGEFVVRLAKTRNLAATDARIAADALRGVGVRVPEDLNYSDTLTEGEVVRLARSFGLNLTTASPDDVFDSEQVDRFFSTFGVDIGFSNTGTGGNSAKAASNGGGIPFNPYSRGKGSSNGHGKGLNKTPKEPK